MARRSQRLSTGNGSASKHKRSASGNATSDSTAKRPKAQHATPVKSQHFRQDGDSDGEESHDDHEDSPSEETGSDFAAAEKLDPADEATSGDDHDEEDDDDSGSDVASAARSQKQTKDVWRPGVKAGLGPGKQLIIKKPKPRSAGKIPYSDETIHENTLLFLADLKANNDRQWLKRECPHCQIT